MNAKQHLQAFKLKERFENAKPLPAMRLECAGCDLFTSCHKMHGRWLCVVCRAKVNEPGFK